MFWDLVREAQKVNEVFAGPPVRESVQLWPTVNEFPVAPLTEIERFGWAVGAPVVGAVGVGGFGVVPVPVPVPTPLPVTFILPL